MTTFIESPDDLWARARRKREDEDLARAAAEGAEPSALVPRDPSRPMIAPPDPPAPEPTETADATADDAAPAAPVEATPFAPAAPDLPDPEQEPARFDASTVEPAAEDDDVWARYIKTRKPPAELGPPPQMKQRGNGMAIAAMIAEGALNHGKNIPGMLMQMGDKPDVEYENYMRRAKAMQDQAGIDNAYAQTIKPRTAGLTPAQAELQRLRLEQGAQRLQIGKSKEERLQKTYAARFDPNEAEDVLDYLESLGTNVDAMRGFNLDKIKAMSPEVKKQVDIAQSDITNAIAAKKARGVAVATMQPKIDTAAGISDATQENKLELVREGGKIKNELDLAKKETERADTLKHPVRGFIVEDEDAYAVSAADAPTRRNMELAAGAYRGLMESLDRMQELRAKYGAELPGEVQGEYETAKTAAIGAVTVLGQTGVLNEGEYQRYSKMIPGITPSLGDALLVFDKDIKGDQIRGVKRALRGTVDAKLFQWGARYDYDSLPGSKKSKKKGRAKEAAPDDGNGGPAGPIEITANGPEPSLAARATPSPEYKAQVTAGKVHVQRPGAKPGWIDADKLQAFKRKYPDAKVID